MCTAWPCKEEVGEINHSGDLNGNTWKSEKNAHNGTKRRLEKKMLQMMSKGMAGTCACGCEF